MGGTNIEFNDQYHSIAIGINKEDLDINEFFELCISLAKAVGYHDSTIDNYLNNK